MKYTILFVLAFTLLFSVFFVLLTRAALAELKYLCMEKALQTSGRRKAYRRLGAR